MKKMKKSIPRKEKHELKPERAVRAKINQWRVSTKKWWFRLGQSRNQDDISENSKSLTNGSLWKSSWDQFDKRAHVFICLDILFPFSSFLIFTSPCMFEPYSFSRINHYFLFFETLFEIHNWAFMHYCKRFRGQWKRNS